ncbi:MAG: hypothetical protein ACLQG5_09750 [Methanobacterium sp.]
MPRPNAKPIDKRLDDEIHILNYGVGTCTEDADFHLYLTVSQSKKTLHNYQNCEENRHNNTANNVEIIPLQLIL